MWLRWAILIGIAYLVYRLLKSRRRWRGAQMGRGGDTAEELMVQDPWCKTFIPRSQALREGEGSDALFFCSPECRERYLGREVGEEEKAKRP
ncbi:MAG: hypothetical protein ACUVXD_00885 [Thermodesulfobacteriota bacterium]